MRVSWTFPRLPAALPKFQRPHCLELEDVAIITRHGIRTPTRDLPFDQTPWDEGMTDALRMSKSTSNHALQLPVNQLYRIKHRPHRPEVPGRAMYRGQLTTQGFEQHIKLGSYLRQRYVREAKILPPAFHRKNSNLFLRSTSFERTFESLQVNIYFVPLYRA